MTEDTKPRHRRAIPDEYKGLFQLMTEEASDYLDDALRVLELNPAEFYRLFCTIGQVWVIEVDSEPLGFFWLELRSGILHVHALVLKRIAQGRGIGSMVMSDVERGFSEDATAIEVGIHHANTRALALCKSQGFKEVGRRPEVGFLIFRKQILR